MHVDVACAACWVGKLNFASGSSSGGTALPEQKTQQVNGEKGVKQDIITLNSSSMQYQKFKKYIPECM